MTEWRDHPRFPHHEISESGQLRRKIKVGNHLSGNLLRGEVTHRGYLRYKVMTDYVKRSGYAHRLVCEAWHGPAPSEQHQAAHNDGNKLNNHFSNLRWATPAENMADCLKHGTILSGERNKLAKLTWENVREIRATCKGEYGQINAMARKLGVTHGCVSHALYGTTWKGK